jgi:catechol 2,3-dioxygenase
MILRIGHAELRVTDLDVARRFYVDALGFVVAAEDRDRLYLRAIEEFDVWTLTLARADAPGLGHFALRVDDPEDLDRLEALHARLDLPVQRMDAGEEPGQGETLRVLGPEGFPIEFYNEMEQLPLYEDGVLLPMRHPGLRHGTGPLRIDHINLRTRNMTATLGYLMQELEFGMSEYIERDEAVFGAWLRRHTGSHDIAVLAAEQSSLHHLAYIVPEAASLVRLCDALADLGFGDAVEFGPARHGVTNALFLYIRDPSGNRIELYAGDYVRDADLPPIKWPWDAFLATGRTWWGAGAPESFAETTPIAGDWLASIAEVAR